MAQRTTTIELHPWNVGFEWADHAGPFRFITPDHARSYDRDGFFVLDDVLSLATVDRLRTEIDGYEAPVEQWLRNLPGERAMIAEADAITFTTHLAERSAIVRELVSSSSLAEIAADLCGPDVRLYWDQAVYKKPEKQRRFPWHQDNGYAYVEPQQYLTCWTPLVDATEANGCPWVVPGLHRLGTLRHSYVEPLGWECFDTHPDARPVPVPAGGVIVFSSLTPHLTGPNTTEAVRKAFIAQYAPDGAKRLAGDPARGASTTAEPCDHPDRQFPVVRGGELVGPGLRR